MANKRRKTQRVITQKDTHRFTKEGTVAASPVHSGAGIKPGGGDTDMLLSSLDALANSAAQAGKDYIDRLKEAGITAAARGEEKPGDRWGGKAYEVATGMANKTTYKNYMAAKQTELFRDNPEISRRKFENEMKKHGNAFTKDKSDNFVVGLSDTLIEVGNSVGASWDEHETTKIQVEGKQSITQMTIDAADEVFAIPAFTDENKKAQFDLMRTKMNDLYKLADVYRLDKTDLTGHLVKALGEKWAAEGSPEKLEWLRMKDGSGIIPSLTKNGLPTEDYIRAAQATRNQKEANAEKAFQTKKDEAAEAIGRDFIVKANTLAPNDAKEWATVRNSIIKYKSLFSYKELNGMYETVDKMQDPGNFSRVGDDLKIFNRFFNAAGNGRLNVADLNRNSKFLTKPTYMKIFTKHINQLNDGKNAKIPPAQKMVESQLKKLGTSTISMAGGQITQTGELIANIKGDTTIDAFAQDVQMLWMYNTSVARDFMDDKGKLDIKAVKELQQQIYTQLLPTYPKLASKLINDKTLVSDKEPITKIDETKINNSNDLDRFIEEDAKK